MLRKICAAIDECDEKMHARILFFENGAHRASPSLPTKQMCCPDRLDSRESSFSCRAGPWRPSRSRFTAATVNRRSKNTPPCHVCRRSLLYRTFPGLEETSISWHLESRFLRLPDVVRNRCGIMSAFRITFDGIHSVCVQRLAKKIEMAQHCVNETHEISLQISLAGVADDS